ncbi:MAG: Dps family protein [Bellilinea sp.]
MQSKLSGERISMGQSRKELTNRMLQVDLQPNIGLEGDDRRAVVEILNKLLPLETGLTINTRFAHWNLRGKEFVEQRGLLSSHSGQLNLILEKLTERVRMLGEIAVDRLQKFFANFKWGDLHGDAPDIKELLAAHEAAIRSLRESAKKCSEEYGDEVTRQFLVEILVQHEKMAWELRTYFET